MTNVDIALLPGDGIGPEVLGEAVKVLQAAQQVVTGFELNFESYDAGANSYLKNGDPLPESTWGACSSADAIFFGSVGLPSVTYPDGTEVGVEAGLRLRFRLDLYANVRPIRLYPNVDAPLKRYAAGDIDYVILRENIEGLYAGRGGGSVTRNAIAVDTMVISEFGTTRASEYAFGLAATRQRVKPRTSRVTCVDKANILRSYSFFRKVFKAVAAKHPDIEPDYAYIDAMACWMVERPDYYDVIVTENMFGDIITDLGAATVGGMGMSPSAEIGDNRALFQGSHGSAPTIAGQNIANPTATILSGAMMLDWLADRKKSESLRTAARAIERAVEQTFSDGVLTKDVGGSVRTSEFADAVIERLRAA